MKKIIIATALIISLKIQACETGFISKNYEIPTNAFMQGSVTKEQFQQTTKEFEIFFNERIDREYRGSELIVYSSWESPTVNAFADQKPNKYLITIYGGLARHPAINQDGLTAVLCHELGHHFGGYPQKSNRWSSAEGQADYYTTMKCLRRFWENTNNILALKDTEIPLKLRSECALTYSSEKERALCHRMGMAGLSVALMIQAIDNDSITPRFETPEREHPRTINYGYPFSQCRLDTFFQGAICPVHESEEFDHEDETIGSCHSIRGNARGIRPRCWFIENT